MPLDHCNANLRQLGLPPGRRAPDIGVPGFGLRTDSVYERGGIECQAQHAVNVIQHPEHLKSAVSSAEMLDIPTPQKAFDISQEDCCSIATTATTADRTPNRQQCICKRMVHSRPA